MHVVMTVSENPGSMAPAVRDPDGAVPVHRRWARHLLIAALAACACLGAACAGRATTAPTSDPLPDLDGGISRSWMARPGIEQRVRLINPRLRTGDTLSIESVLKNVGADTVQVNRVVCELDVTTDLKIDAPFILCFAYSITGPLAPGQETAGWLHRVVRSPPGRYQLSIRHLLEPSVWVPTGLTVYP
jgi:hypothetical protein